MGRFEVGIWCVDVNEEQRFVGIRRIDDCQIWRNRCPMFRHHHGQARREGIVTA